MAFKDNVKLVLKDVAKGLISILIPQNPERKIYLTLHWCPECQSYHRVPDKPYSRKTKKMEHLNLHWCQQCQSYHKVPEKS